MDVDSGSTPRSRWEGCVDSSLSPCCGECLCGGSVMWMLTLVAQQGPGGKVVLTVHAHHVVVSVCVVAV